MTLAVAATAVWLGAVIWPVSASAEVICRFDPQSRLLEFRLTEKGDYLQLYAPTGGNYGIYSTYIECEGQPTVNNTDLVRVRDRSGGRTTVELKNPDSFGPGATSAGGDAGTATDEVEVDIRQGGDPHDLLRLNGSEYRRVRWQLGNRGLNLNARDEVKPDADFRLRGVDHLSLAPSAPGVIDGRGRRGTGSARPRRFTVYGGTDPLRLFGGDGPDELLGGFAVDQLRGGPGNDLLDGGDGPDLLAGGRGSDTGRWGSGVDGDLKVDLRRRGAQEGSSRDESENGERRDRIVGIENMIGSGHDDILIGDSRANTITGFNGSDRLIGHGGADRIIEVSGYENGLDVIRAGRGRDLIDSRDEDRDRVLDCGPGFDRLLPDPFERGRARRCEQIRPDG